MYEQFKIIGNYICGITLLAGVGWEVQGLTPHILPGRDNFWLFHIPTKVESTLWLTMSPQSVISEHFFFRLKTDTKY